MTSLKELERREYAQFPKGAGPYEELIFLTRAELNALIAALRDDEEEMQAAWGLIANASGGNWHFQADGWVEAAENWRDRWHRRHERHGIGDDDDQI
jgi:hypothetical protein